MLQSGIHEEIRHHGRFCSHSKRFDQMEGLRYEYSERSPVSKLFFLLT